MTRRDPLTLPLFGRLTYPQQVSPPEPDGLLSLSIGARTIEYRLKRSHRRTLGMRIDHRGVQLAAPLNAPTHQIEAFLRSNAAWVFEKLEVWGAAQQKRPLMVSSGIQIPLLGEPCRLTLSIGPWRASWSETELRLTVPPRLSAAAALRMAMEERAIELFRQRAHGLAAVLGVDLPRIALSNAQGRWGSCSRRSGVRLNWRLLHLPLALIDYVVAHELAHLIEMNHSPRFWAVVARACPDYRTRRDALKAWAHTLPQF